MKVSVVVPVFNTGPGIESLIGSLRAQSLPATEWEAVFVDDGSTDDTPALVARLIAGEPNMRLIREPASGWPGRPRNVGMDAAAGDYVFFSDDDDTLGPEALERLTAFADVNGSDVVVPKTVGRNRGVPLVPRTVVDARDDVALIMSSLAPRKLFRLAFLRKQGIRSEVPLPELDDPEGHLPPAEAVLAQVAEYTRIGAELHHDATGVRRTLRVEHLGGGVSVATTRPGEAALDDGTWTVMALAGEHRTRRRRTVDAGRGMRIEQRRRLVGGTILQLQRTHRMALGARPEGTRDPSTLVSRVERRLRRTVAQAVPAQLLRLAHG